MDSLGTAVSVALQYGVPVQSLVNKFTHQRFEPAGMTHNRDIPFAKSLVDYIFRWMGMEFIPGYRDANAPKRGQDGHGGGGGEVHQGATGARLSEDATWRSSPSESRISGMGNGNGNGHGHGERLPDAAPPRGSASGGPGTPLGGALTAAPLALHAASSVLTYEATASATLTIALDSAGDAPACDGCGTITVRSGTCYKCLNCGNSMGCS